MSKQGFASMDKKVQRDLASRGGKRAHEKGTAHEWTSEEAREVGRKGGLASQKNRKRLKEKAEARRVVDEALELRKTRLLARQPLAVVNEAWQREAGEALRVLAADDITS